MPGITRYHRAGCILIRFLGAEDLETMTKQAAEEGRLRALQGLPGPSRTCPRARASAASLAWLVLAWVTVPAAARR